MNIQIVSMQASADRAGTFLRVLSHPQRLMIVCYLLDGEQAVGELAERLGLRDSAVSQHLALLRSHGIVATRREAQTIWYSISSAPARDLVETLYRSFCSAHQLPHGQ